MATSLSESLHLTTDEARRHYVELIARDDNPRDGDAELLGRVLDVLGLTVGDFRNDVRAVDEAGAIEATYQDKEAISAKVKQEREKRDDFEAATKRIIQEREAEQAKLNANVQAALNDLQAQNDRESRVKELRRQHRLAFGLEPKREAPKPPAGVIQTTRSEIVPPPAYREGERPFGPMPGEHDLRDGQKW